MLKIERICRLKKKKKTWPKNIIFFKKNFFTDSLTKYSHLLLENVGRAETVEVYDNIPETIFDIRFRNKYINIKYWIKKNLKKYIGD